MPNFDWTSGFIGVIFGALFTIMGHWMKRVVERFLDRKNPADPKASEAP